MKSFLVDFGFQPWFALKSKSLGSMDGYRKVSTPKPYLKKNSGLLKYYLKSWKRILIWDLALKTFWEENFPQSR